MAKNNVLAELDCERFHAQHFEMIRGAVGHGAVSMLNELVIDEVSSIWEDGSRWSRVNQQGEVPLVSWDRCAKQDLVQIKPFMDFYDLATKGLIDYVKACKDSHFDIEGLAPRAVRKAVVNRYGVGEGMAEHTDIKPTHTGLIILFALTDGHLIEFTDRSGQRHEKVMESGDALIYPSGDVFNGYGIALGLNFMPPHNVPINQRDLTDYSLAITSILGTTWRDRQIVDLANL